MAEIRKLEFYNTVSMSLECAAILIRQEGKLGSGSFLNENTGLRCILGVLGDYTKHNRDKYKNSYYASRFIKSSSLNDLSVWLGGVPTMLNDDFIGSPEARAIYMAELFEVAAKGGSNGKS